MPAVAAPLVQASEIVVHFAAETHVDRSLMNAGEFITTDVFGTFVLLEAARQAPALRRFVQISTDEVYGSVPEGSSRETDELRPRNPYSASKAGADRLAYSYWATYGVPVIITRASNNYGPYQFPEKLIPLFITNAIDDMPGAAIWRRAARARLAARAAITAARVDLLIESRHNGEVYNVGGGNHVATPSHAADSRAARQAADADPARRGPPGPRPPLLARHDQAAMLGWTPQVTFEEGLAETVVVVPGRTNGGGGRSKTRTRSSRSITRPSTARRT